MSRTSSDPLLALRREIKGGMGEMEKRTFPVRLFGGNELEGIHASTAMGRLEDLLDGDPYLL